MALNGSLTTGYWTADDGRTRGYTLSWTATQSIEYNQSTISWTLSTAGSYPYQVAERTLVVILAGNTLVNKSNRVMRGTGVVASGSFVVNHDSNGNFSFSGSIQAAVFVSSINCTASGNFSLNTIPRQANITSANNFNDEENPTIKYSNPAGNSVTSLEACISLTGAVGDIPYRAISKTGSSYTFELTDEERDVLRNATLNGSNSRTVIFYVRTKIGSSTFHSTAARTFTVINASPTIEPTIKDVNPLTLRVTNDKNIFIRYKSDAEIFTVAKAYKGASIVSQKVICGGQNLTEESGVIKSVESSDFVFSATDNRGNTVTKTVTKQFIEYINLTCELTEIYSSADGKVSFNIKGNYFNGSFGTKNNYILLEYRYKEGYGDFTEWQADSAVVSGNKYNAHINLIGLDYRKECTIEARVSDILTEANDEKTVRTVPLFDWGKEDFNFNCSVKILGRNIFDIIYPVGSIYMSVNDTNPSELFGGEWERLKDRFLLGAGDTYEADSTGGSATNTHNHYTTSSFDGENFYAEHSSNATRSRVVTKNRISWTATAAKELTREDSTYDETINIMPPYMAVYMWKRIA